MGIFVEGRVVVSLSATVADVTNIQEELRAMKDVETEREKEVGKQSCGEIQRRPMRGRQFTGCCRTG